MNAEEAFSGLLQRIASPEQMTQELGQNDETPVRPAAPLNQESPEVRRRRAEGESLGEVMQLPSLGEQVDARLRVLDHRSIRDVSFDFNSILVLALADIDERLHAKERVRADPISAAVLGEALVDVVLDVGGDAGDALQHSRRFGYCA